MRLSHSQPSKINHAPLTELRENDSLNLLPTPPDHANAARPFHTLDTGLNELVAKLQALQAHGNDDEKDYEVAPVLDPLPPNAKCPGAPKIPAVFRMPLFPTDDDCEDKENHIAFELKSVNSHHMTPLAEVTEAYTGLQGGWSPPLETSPLLDTYSFQTVAISPASVHVGPSQSIQSDHELLHGKALGISFHVEKLPLGTKRRRDQTFAAVSSYHQLPSVATKGPLRI